MGSLVALGDFGSSSEAEQAKQGTAQPERGLVPAWALGVRGCSGDQGLQPASSGSPCPAPAPPAIAIAIAGAGAARRAQGAGGAGRGGERVRELWVHDTPEA